MTETLTVNGLADSIPEDTNLVVVLRGVDPTKIHALLNAIQHTSGLAGFSDNRPLSLEAFGFNDQLSMPIDAEIANPEIFKHAAKLVDMLRIRDLEDESRNARPPLPDGADQHGTLS